jgi:3-dehydroquinate synthase
MKHLVEKNIDLKDYFSVQNTVVITDHNVSQIYRGKLAPYQCITIQAGESSKNLQTMQSIYDQCLDMEIDRNSLIVGFGGGVICDVAGFVGATYMRGVDCCFVPTTLLAQVDASIGGKNGVNLHGYKNIIGTFYQPKLILCDLNLLKTLPEKEIKNGMAEIVKHASIASSDLFEFLEQSEISSCNISLMEKLVCLSARIKTNIVTADEKEQNERRKLNFGHTLGHALEKLSGISHGEAVSIGMVAAAKISVRKQLLERADSERLEKLLKRLGLPTKFYGDVKEVVQIMRKDKKRIKEGVYYILLRNIGDAVIEKIDFEEIEEILYDLC